MIVCLNINCYVTVKENVMLRVTQKIGTLTVEVAAEQPKDIIQQLAFFGTLPAVCPFALDEVTACGLPLQLTFKTIVPQQGEHKGKTLKYYGMRCANTPAHECNFGQRADDSSIFYKGASSFQVEYKAREGAREDYHGDHEDHGRQQQGAPREQARDSFNETAAGVAPTEQPEHGNGGPTSGQRTLMSKLLAEKKMTMAQAAASVGASLAWEEMNPGQAARFIDAVKKAEVPF